MTPTEQLANVLARLPKMERRCERDLRLQTCSTIVDHSEFLAHGPQDLLGCISVIKQFPTMREQAKREAFEEAAKAMCRRCQRGDPVTSESTFNNSYGHLEPFIGEPGGEGVYRYCDASPVHRKLAEGKERR